MAANRAVLPSGSADMLFETCALKEETEGRLRKIYNQRGYREVATSFFEYYDTFLLAGTLTQDRMCVLTDSEGYINVLRPDLTAPIARLAAKRLADSPLPLRLCYNQSVFRREPGGGRNIVIPQSGIELLGVSGLKADADAIMTAVAALDCLGLPGFKIELGHVGIFKALSERIRFAEGDFERVRQGIQNKNYAALGDILSYYKEDYPDECVAINMLPRLFGGMDVFEKARGIIKDAKALELLGGLEELLKKIESIRPDTVIVDLGLVQHIDYYTGLVFSAYLENAGEAALSGGRYDGLTGAFNADLPAVGFAINLNVVLAALERADRGRGVPPPEVLIHYDNGFGKEAYELMDKLAAEGRSCEMGLFEEIEANLELARRRGAKRLLIVGKGVEEREVRP